MSLRDNNVARFCGACLEANPICIGLPSLPYRRFPNLRRANVEQFRGLPTRMSAIQQVWKPALVCPAGVWSIGMKGSRRGLVTPTVAEPPGRLREEPARKGGRQTFDRRNTNGQ